MASHTATPGYGRGNGVAPGAVLALVGSCDGLLAALDRNTGRHQRFFACDLDWRRHTPRVGHARIGGEPHPDHEATSHLVLGRQNFRWSANGQPVGIAAGEPDGAGMVRASTWSPGSAVRVDGRPPTGGCAKQPAARQAHGDKHRADSFDPVPVETSQSRSRGRPRAWPPRARRRAPHVPATRRVRWSRQSGIEPTDHLARGTSAVVEMRTVMVSARSIVAHRQRSLEIEST
jgi:hypothetical protein